MGGSVNESLSVTERDGQESSAVPSESKELWHPNRVPNPASLVLLPLDFA